MRHMEKYTAVAALVTAVSPVHAITPSDVPLYLTTGSRANVLFILDNSNSMDEAPNGAAVGSNSPESKSEIARSVLRQLVVDYQDKINMGLMAYRQNNPQSYHLHNSPYDVSYNPANYDPSFSGPRNSTTKRYRTPNPTSPGNFIHYNVALPFYSTNNQGNGFCYSPSANFDNGTETYPGGPWDAYRCFRAKTGTQDGVIDPLPGGGITAAETALGYATLLGRFTFWPTDSDLAQGILDFGKQISWTYVGRTWFRNNSPGRGYLHTPIRLLDATHRASIESRLKCNIPLNPAPCNASGIRNAGLTPIEGTLLTARDYFLGSWANTAEGYVASGANKSYPLPTSCGKDFVVLLTDGLPSTRANGTPISNPSVALAEAATAAQSLKDNGIETYVVGFALPYGTNPATLDILAAAGGTDTSFYADDYATLASALNGIFADIMKKTSSAAALATNSTRLSTDSVVYQARFNSDGWSGQLLAVPVNGSGGTGTPLWDAADHMPAAAVRNIKTWNGASGTDFVWANLTASQQTALGSAAILDYLRGDASNEKKHGGSYRNRNAPLGDIVNSDPVFVGVQNYGYDSLTGVEGEGATYKGFLATKAARPKMLYVGANDGMLHGFDTSTGVERLAYVPNAVFPNLASLASPGYTHKYYVDGSPWAGDAYFKTPAEAAAKWRSVLVGGTGAGGKAIFALDVSNPASFSTADVLWEYTHSELGYTIGQPMIARLNDGRWAAVFGNGYASTGGTAKLFIVYLDADASNGWQVDTDYRVLNTSTSTSTGNGLSSPTLYDQNGDRIVDYVYAGDLQGNVWKFDLSSANPNLWKVAHKSGSTNIPFFTARNASNQAQSITGAIEIGPAPPGKVGVMLYFGTGRYFAVGDNTSTQVQSFYALWDDFTSNNEITYSCSAGSCNRDSVLQAQTIVYEGAGPGTHTVRVTSANAVDYGSKRGWYLDLLPPSGTAKGERVVSAPLLRHGRVIFTTLIPSSDPCMFGGDSWIMELAAKTGSRLDYSVFDLNDDVLFNNSDYVTVTLDWSSQTVPVSGVASKVGIIKTPTVISAGEKEYKLASGTTGEIASVREKGGGTGFGRVSWQELYAQ